jgi:hypothetical protein
MAARARSDWHFARAVARVRPVEAILADYATTVCGLPVRRTERRGENGERGQDGERRGRPGVTWSIDGDVMVELVVSDDGPDHLLVRELSLLGPLRKALRTRHLRIEYGSSLHEG